MTDDASPWINFAGPAVPPADVDADLEVSIDLASGLDDTDDLAAPGADAVVSAPAVSAAAPNAGAAVTTSVDAASVSALETELGAIEAELRALDRTPSDDHA